MYRICYICPTLSGFSMSETTAPFPSASLRHLAVVANPEGFLFMDADQPEAQPLTLKMDAPVDFPDEFVHFVNQSGWSDHASLRVTVSEHSNRFMVMPAHLGAPEFVQELFNAAFIGSEKTELYQFPLSDGKNVFVCGLLKERIECFETLFNNLHIYNPTHLLTEWTMQQARICNESVLLAYCFGKNLHIAVARPNTLMFANSFDTKGEQDATYFCLRVIEQLQLDPLTLYAFVCTPENREHPLKNALSTYLNRVDQLIYTGLPEVPVTSYYP